MAQNMIQDILRTQMVMGMGASQSGWQSLRNIVLLNIYDKIASSYTVWFPFVKHTCCRRKNKATPPPIHKSIQASIECEHILKSSNNKNTQISNNSRMDAVIHHITNIPSLHNLLCISHHDYLPHEFEAVSVDTDIYFQLVTLNHSDGQLEKIEFKLFSYDHDVQFIQEFIENCDKNYTRRMANKLGNSIYYFDMVTQSKSKKSLQNPLPGTYLMYTKNLFQTTRTFDNIFFEQRDHVRTHYNFFLERKDWYEKKGIPYTLGFMFHGDPGCGKTSTVKAIANCSRRHVINVQLSQIKTRAQLRHLFFSDEIHVYDGTKSERYTIPINERIYVMEDIDAMGDSVLRREWQKPTSAQTSVSTIQEPWQAAHEPDESEPIDLSFLLNLLDGTLEASGRILVISSNFPERIDKALIRPGRIDMIVHYKKCNIEILKQIVTNFYDKDFGDWTIPEIEYRWTPAEVNQILFRNFNKPQDALNELKTLHPKDLYGFQAE